MRLARFVPLHRVNKELHASFTTFVRTEREPFD